VLFLLVSAAALVMARLPDWDDDTCYALAYTHRADVVLALTMRGQVLCFNFLPVIYRRASRVFCGAAHGYLTSVVAAVLAFVPNQNQQERVAKRCGTKSQGQLLLLR
jgi:hypothetical protein